MTCFHWRAVTVLQFESEALVTTVHIRYAACFGLGNMKACQVLLSGQARVTVTNQPPNQGHGASAAGAAAAASVDSEANVRLNRDGR